MRVSLFMPTLNAGPLLDTVLDGIARQPGAQEVEMVALDSGSTDDTIPKLRAAGFTVDSIDKKDFNHGRTRDWGIERTTGDIIVLLTQDAVPADEHWLASLISAYDDPATGAAYCRQIPREDCNPLIKHRLEQWTAGQNERVIQRVEGDPAAALEAMEPMQRLQTCAYDNVAGSVRRTCWERIPFGFRRFGEDVAFGKRVILSGQSIVFEPRAAVVHSHNRTPQAEGKRIFCDHENLRELFDVHLMPTYDHYVNGARGGREEFRRIIHEIDMEPGAREQWLDWSDRYAQWSALGMYLGGNAKEFRAGAAQAWFGFLEEHLRAGI